MVTTLPGRVPTVAVGYTDVGLIWLLDETEGTVLTPVDDGRLNDR